MFCRTPPYPLNGLIHYWPIAKDTTDYLTNSVLQPTPTSFVYGTNRFDRVFTSLIINGNYFKLPNRIYFYGDFTVTVWINPQSYAKNARIIDCGNGAANDTIFISYSSDLTGRPFVGIFNQANGDTSMISPLAVQTNVWTHLAATLNGNNLRLYINATQVGQWSVSYLPRSVTRRACYFGKSDFSDVDPSNFLLDQLKIYNRSLFDYEISNDLKASWI